MTRTEGDAKHYCPNSEACPTQIKGKFEHFISRKAMNIDGLGPEKIELLLEGKFITILPDLYKLKEVSTKIKGFTKFIHNDSILEFSIQVQ